MQSLEYFSFYFTGKDSPYSIGHKFDGYEDRKGELDSADASFTNFMRASLAPIGNEDENLVS
jgi:hypothetical protein